MEFGKGVFEVKATSGDTRLGGTDMDGRLIEMMGRKAEMGVDPMSLGEFNLDGLPPAARGVPKIEVSFASTPPASSTSPPRTPPPARARASASPAPPGSTRRTRSA